MKDTREVFSCWIGEQEKEIRNVKPSTTVKDVLIALLKEHLYTVLSSGIDDEDVRQSLPGLTKQLMSDFAIYMNCIEVDHAKYVTTLPAMNVYKMRMKQPADALHHANQSDEINITRAILLQAERISEQNMILKQIDRDIISSQTACLHSNDIIRVDELQMISDSIHDLTRSIDQAESRVYYLQNQINAKVNCINSRQHQHKNHHHRQQSSESDNPFDKKAHKSHRHLHQKLASNKGRITPSPQIQSPDLNSSQRRKQTGSEHKPVIRRDVEPVKHSANHKAKQFVGVNTKLVRSMSEMHLTQHKKYIDTDSDTGFSSLDSFDEDNGKSETLV